jgi:hypothetical protein
VVILAREAIDPVAGAETVRVSGAYEAAAELLAARESHAGRLALVIDLGLLWPRHLGLLQVARNLHAEMLAFGTAVAGLDAEQLAGLRLVSRASLPEALAQFVDGRGESGLAEESGLPEDLSPIDEPLRSEESLRAEELFKSEEAVGTNGSVPPKPADAAARDGRRAEGKDGRRATTRPAASPAAAARLVPAKQPRPAEEETLTEDETLAQAPSLDSTLESGDGDGAIPSRPPAAGAVNPGSLLTPEELSALLGEEGQ